MKSQDRENDHVANNKIPKISPISVSPPTEKRWNLRFSADAIDLATEVLPTLVIPQAIGFKHVNVSHKCSTNTQQRNQTISTCIPNAHPGGPMRQRILLVILRLASSSVPIPTSSTPSLSLTSSPLPFSLFLSTFFIPPS